MGTYLRVLSESYTMNTNKTGLKYLHPCALDKNSLGIGRVNFNNSCLKISLTGVVWIYGTFRNNFRN